LASWLFLMDARIIFILIWTATVLATLRPHTII